MLPSPVRDDLFTFACLPAQAISLRRQPPGLEPVGPSVRGPTVSLVKVTRADRWPDLWQSPRANLLQLTYAAAGG